ncbi:hypothetical protein DENSPDRAFT_855522 [Dentipellis sp. KUC8613]|nr:hypothetical protein DENSPDRAFT_855522 [Dentipellis sp. KUC8613]
MFGKTFSKPTTCFHGQLNIVKEDDSALESRICFRWEQEFEALQVRFASLHMDDLPGDVGVIVTQVHMCASSMINALTFSENPGLLKSARNLSCCKHMFGEVTTSGKRVIRPGEVGNIPDQCLIYQHL